MFKHFANAVSVPHTESMCSSPSYKRSNTCSLRGGLSEYPPPPPPELSRFLLMRLILSDSRNPMFLANHVKSLSSRCSHRVQSCLFSSRSRPQRSSLQSANARLPNQGMLILHRCPKACDISRNKTSIPVAPNSATGSFLLRFRMVCALVAAIVFQSFLPMLDTPLSRALQHGRFASTASEHVNVIVKHHDDLVGGRLYRW